MSCECDLEIIAGAQGPRGAAGKSMLSGMGVPDASLGSNGDFYINLANFDLYGPKANNAWALATNMIGPQGPPNAGVKQFPAANYTPAFGDGFGMLDVTAASRAVALTSLIGDADIIIKDYLGGVDGISRFVTVTGTLDGILNPTKPLIQVPYGWARLIYTQTKDIWSLVG